jgi:hypothetical protein
MYIKALTLMQIMAIDSINLNVIGINDGINANNAILICLRRYYIESCNHNIVVSAEGFPLYCKTTNNLSRYKDMYHTIQNMVLSLWQNTASMAQPLLACPFIKSWHRGLFFFIPESATIILMNIAKHC